MNAVIDMHEVSKRFRRTVAVDGLTLAVPEGAVTAFLGPNGAGKTTTIKCILDMLRPERGSITVCGQDSRRLGPEQLRQIGYVSENQELPLWMTVGQFLDYCRPMYPTWDGALAARLLKVLDLPLDRTLRALSRGMRVKAALLSSLAYRPRLVILDEPFSGLDPLVRDEFVRGLLELTEQEGWTVFISSHDIEEVERLADRVAVIDRGRLQLAEPVENLQQRFRSVEVALPDAATVPVGLPASWLNPEANGRVVCFTDSAFDEAELAAAVARHFPAAKQHQVTLLSLRQIFVALARTYRLDRPAAAKEAAAP
jgi:ABC-2 type transport system ATP-binding protein